MFIQSDKQIKTVIYSDFTKHIIGTPEYEYMKKRYQKVGKHGPSYLTIDKSECEELISKYAGTGKLKYNKRWRKTKDRNITEVITENDKVVGHVVNDLTGEEVETTVFKIHYSKRGAHIVPDYPSKKNSKRR